MVHTNFLFHINKTWRSFYYPIYNLHNYWSQLKFMPLWYLCQNTEQPLNHIDNSINIDLDRFQSATKVLLFHTVDFERLVHTLVIFENFWLQILTTVSNSILFSKLKGVWEVERSHCMLYYRLKFHWSMYKWGLQCFSVVPNNMLN